MHIDRRRPDILVVDELLSAAELTTLRTLADRAQFERQDLGPVGLRSRARAVLDDQAIVSILWTAVAPLLGNPADWLKEAGLGSPLEQWEFCGCNPRTRFYSYGLGGDFAPHEDESWRPNETTRSLLTLLLYLGGDECLGGATVVDGEVIAVKPGRIAVFDHRLLHEGKAVERGTKLVLRNDIVASANRAAQ